MVVRAINSIQFGFIYVQYPITELARVCRNRNAFKEQNRKYDSLYNNIKIITIPRKNKLVLKSEEKNK
jgi:hypothetical protein